MTFAALLAVDAVKEGVDHHIAAVDSQLGKKALDSVPSRPNPNPASHLLVLGRILADEHHPSAAVKSSAMEHRSPLGPEVGSGIDVAAGIVAAELIERRLKVAWIKIDAHWPLPPVS